MKHLNTILIILVLLAGRTYGQPAPPLTVVVVIDMFPMHVVNAYEDLFGSGGFKRLEHEGVFFTECRFSHAVTETGPGHVTISTGCNPRSHGIVANGWQLLDGSDVYCVSSDDVHPVTQTGVVDSTHSFCPERIETETLADVWRKGFGTEARIWSMSTKDRAAVGLAGRSANGALWLNWDDGTFQSSTYYMENLPEWCRKYNERSGLYFDSVWTKALAESVYVRSGVDNALYEDGTKSLLSNTFPKALRAGDKSPGKNHVRALQSTPFGNEWLHGLMKTCIEREQLGKDATPDLLLVSYSCNDMCGHTFGPNSHEILDMTVRTDRLVEDLLQYLDSNVGTGNYWLALTTDHGACPACESPFVPQGTGGRFNMRKMREELQDYLAQRFLAGIPPQKSFVSAFEIPTVYLNQESIAEANLELRDVASAVVEWLRMQKGIAQAHVTISADDIENIHDENLRNRIRESNFPGRFSQVYLHPEPYWQSDGITSNHGTVHDYDAHVPLYLFGLPLGNGIVTTPSDPADLAATLANYAGLKWKTAREGKVHVAK